MNPSERNKLCNFIRKEVLTMVYSAKEGHIGSSFSCVEAIVTLYFDIMNIDSKNPEWDKRDRFVLSKGHAAPVLYSVLSLKGFLAQFQEWGINDFKNHLPSTFIIEPISVMISVLSFIHSLLDSYELQHGSFFTLVATSLHVCMNGCAI